MVTEAGKSEIKVPAGSVSCEGPLLGSDSGLLVVSSQGRREKEAPWGLFNKVPNPT